MNNKAAIWLIALTMAWCATSCRKPPSDGKWAPGGKTADFTGTIPETWPLCPPFIDGNVEAAKGFLVVEAVKPCHTSDASGVQPGDIFLSWDSDTPAPTDILLDNWLSFLQWKRDPGGCCWFARDCDGTIQIFSCEAEVLFECEVALGTFCLRLVPAVFAPVEIQRILVAVATASAPPPSVATP